MADKKASNVIHLASKSGQLELDLKREFEPDRNFSVGGRSFYFFDLDDNVFFLPTSIYLFHKISKQQLPLTTAEYAKWGRLVGQKGTFKEFELNLEDNVGSFRRFRDHGGESPIVEDIRVALQDSGFHWKGPSWSCFYHAVFNKRPVALITARGHSADSIKAAIQVLVEAGHLPHEPNYLEVFAVSHPQVRRVLGDDSATLSISQLKKNAIEYAVESAMKLYGENPNHRFGMSDDSEENIELITEAMRRLKRRYSENSFFVINTFDEKLLKSEVFSNDTEPKVSVDVPQLDLQLDT